jgi:arabinofuranosyltransferase
VSSPRTQAPGALLGSRSTIALALFATACLLWLALRANFLIDDAFISFRYAKNWSEWGVPAFNPGEEPPVEGYSNFLWVLLLRWGYAAGLAPEVLSRVLSISASVLTLWCVLAYARRELRLTIVPMSIAGIALATMPPFTTWATGGLETALFGLSLFLAFAGLTSRANERSEVMRGALCGLAGIALALTRPEGFLWIAGLSIVAILAPTFDRSRSIPAQRIRVFSIVAVLGLTLHMAWRRSMHGDWLPNTVRAKAGFSAEVFERGFDNSLTYLLLFATPMLAVLSLILHRRRADDQPSEFASIAGARRCAAFAVTAMLLGGGSYSLLVGGDWMPMFRFLAPISSFVAIGLALTCARIPAMPGGLIGTVAIGIAVLPSFGLSLAPQSLLERHYFRTFRKGYESEHERWQSSVANADSFALIGRGLATVEGGSRGITLGAIGAIGYYSGWLVYDRNGLVEPEVARLPIEAGSGTAGHDRRVARSWFRSRQPDVYEVMLAAGTIRNAQDPGFAAAARGMGQRVIRDGEASLLEHALPEVHPLPEGNGIPANTTLVLLRHTNAPNAREFWKSLGL